eukprot:CAMPEP_0176321746 /NCGR_PEP_ID=MMETSP0121_2-20121125/71509_1 /TAXON_ID=160619 /ORGANISM="Kryptoperidinium foliaceum, Strain CCMP 1326" /LENGTH=187 /DNA_ID=CAMNT_0017664201 /DNA_START=27 /DNA_END=587 /DNA_ORIENTATION=-
MEEKDMAKEAAARMKSGKKGKGVKGKKFKANAGKRDLEMDLPTLVLVDGVLTDSEVVQCEKHELALLDEGNSLQVNMDVKVKGDKPPKMEEKDMAKEAEARMKSGKKGKGVKGKKFKANAGKRDLEMDLPTLVLVDGVLTDSEVEMDAKGTKTSITFSFPHFNQTLLYDPTAGLEEPASDSTSIDGG